MSSESSEDIFNSCELVFQKALSKLFWSKGLSDFDKIRNVIESYSRKSG